jgi:hypothetical protein
MPAVKTKRQAPAFYVGMFGLFLVISIYLSFQVKSMHRQIVLAQQQQQHLQKDLHATTLRFQLLQEVFLGKLSGQEASLNGLVEACLRKHIKSTPHPITVLYLKAHACTACNQYLIARLIKRYADKDWFYVLAHRSNMHFVADLFSEEQLLQRERIIWVHEEMYPGRYSPYESGLLVLNEQKDITAHFPAEFFQDAQLFDQYTQWISSRMN